MSEFFVGYTNCPVCYVNVLICMEKNNLSGHLKRKFVKQMRCSSFEWSLVALSLPWFAYLISPYCLFQSRTWSKSIPGKVEFFSSEGSDTSIPIPIVPLPGVDDSYPPQKKSFMMLKYMHDHYLDKYEWFMRADDDVYIKGDKLENFLRSLNSSEPLFLGQTGLGTTEEMGKLALEPGENFCMGGPGVIMSREVLRRMVPHIGECLREMYTTHEDVEVGRCVRRFAGVQCVWSYEVRMGTWRIRCVFWGRSGQGGRGWQQGVAVMWLCSGSSRAQFPAQLDHPTVPFLHSLFPVKRHPGIDLHKYRSATVRREMEPDIRHIGARGGTFIIHNSHFLDRKGISLNQNGHGSLQSWLFKPLLLSLAGYVMGSVWKIDDTIPLRLTAVEMCKADRCLLWQWQFFPNVQPWQRCLVVAGAVTLHAELPPSLPTAQVHPADACSAGPWRQQRKATALTWKLGVCPHWCGCEIWHLGGKKNERPQPVCGRVSCWGLVAPPRGEGASAWVHWVLWSKSWVFPDCLIETTC